MKEKHKLLTFFSLRNTHFLKHFTKISHFTALSFLPFSLLGLLVFTVYSSIWFTCNIDHTSTIHLSALVPSFLLYSLAHFICP